MLLKNSDALRRYEAYTEKHIATKVDPLRTYSGWLWDNKIDVMDDDEEPFVFEEKPVVKSSTNVLKASVCQRCGCKLDGQPLQRPCDCRCHKGGPR